MGKKILSFIYIVIVCFLCGCAPRELPAAAPQKSRLIWIELDRKRLTLYENGREKMYFPIAAGAGNSPTPVGIFHINRRYVTELSGFGTRFLGLNVAFGDYGIHGTNKPSSIGGNFSHGCIRMYIRDAEKLYPLASYGMQVVIDGGPWGPFTNGLRTLSPGDRGSDVKEVQLRLIAHGFLSGWPDGVYGENTKKAVIAARKAFHLPDGHQVDWALYTKLGIMQFE